MNTNKQKYYKWRKERTQQFIDNINKLTSEFIEIYGDTTLTRCNALDIAKQEKDNSDSEWDAWQAGYKCAISDQTK